MFRKQKVEKTEKEARYGQYGDVGRADKYATKRPIDPMKPPINSPRAGTQPPPTHTDTRKFKTSLLVFNKRTKRTARTYEKGWEEDYMGKMAREASSITKANARREGKAKPFSRIPRPARTRSTNTQKCARPFLKRPVSCGVWYRFVKAMPSSPAAASKARASDDGAWEFKGMVKALAKARR
ncbi:hypothetical protein K4K61_001570 [Colletotrichum sp. SAR11_59]|nr:hypothetical protein K4K61_001570 [Colletotrichum sp. SAR11_59]